MSSPARALYNNLGVTATWSQTTGGAATGYPLTNLNNDKRSRLFRSTTTTGHQVIVATLSTATTLYAIFLANWRAHASGGTIKIETKNGGGAYSNFGGGTGLCSLPASNRTKLTGLWNTGGTVATDIRITFTNTGGVSDYVELGLAFIAGTTGYFAATSNLSDNGYQYRPKDNSQRAVTVGMQEEFNLLPTLLTLTATFEWMALAQQQAMLAMHDAAGTSRPVIFAPNPDSLDEIAYGRFSKFNPIYETLDQWTVDLEFQEAA